MISRTKRGYKIVAYLPVPRNEAKIVTNVQLHEEFANLRDEPEAFQFFTKRWGPLHRSGWEEVGHKAKLAVRNNLRAAWRGEENGFSKPRSPLPALLRLEKNHFEIQTHDLLGTVVTLFLRDHWAGKTAICANPDCLTPYFVKKRKTQKYCESGPCVDQAQREQKRLWWERNRGKGAKQ
jgi:hypothetical protein